MGRYYENDYAINKNNENIVYKFTNGEMVEITLEMYLEKNPNKTKDDFLELKVISDDIYHKEDNGDTKYNKRKWSIHSMEANMVSPEKSVLDKFIYEEDSKKALDSARELLKDKNLTDIQKRRFILYHFKGLSTRKIGELEGVSNVAVFKSIKGVNKKLQKNFHKKG